MAFNTGGHERSPLSAPTRPGIGFRIPRLRFEVRLVGLILLLTAPSLFLAGVLLHILHAPILLQTALFAGLLVLMSWLASTAFRHVVHPLQTLSNVVAALRENEYSFRARDVGAGDALGDLAAQINELAGDLRTRRHRESEAFALLEQVVETMDLPVFAFDASSRLQLTNPAASGLLQQPIDSLLQQTAASLGLDEVLACADNSIVALTMHGREGRWMVRRSRFYQGGVPHTLLLLSDVSGVLREQERQTWQRLIRVLAHEVNNSLTPIKSIAGSLRSRVQPSLHNISPSLQEKPTINSVDMDHGLAIIEERAESLNRFLQAYSQLAKLPSPIKTNFPIAPLLERVCHLETRVHVMLHIQDEIVLYADAAQLEQALINLVRNAADAAMLAESALAESVQPGSNGSTAPVKVICCIEHGQVTIAIEDNGTGLANPANLFVPFYTTKPGGTGIGLILALQIVEAHGGTLTVANRTDAPGCCAEIRLPVISAVASYASSSIQE